MSIDESIYREAEEVKSLTNELIQVLRNWGNNHHLASTKGLDPDNVVFLSAAAYAGSVLDGVCRHDRSKFDETLRRFIEKVELAYTLAQMRE